MVTGLFGPNAVQAFHLAGGDAGTSSTIAKIRELVNRGKKDIEINRLAIGLVWNTPQFSQTEKAQAIFDWVQRNFRFITMIVGAQTLRTPREILRVQAGDCANLNAVLIPSMLETIGIPARLVTVASDAEAPNEFTHVYAEAYVDGQWVPMDVARPGAYFGRAPEHVFRTRIWDLNSSRYQDVPGLSGMLGIMGRRRGRGMGQDDGDFNINSLVTSIPSIESGTASIIAASRAAPTNIFASSTGGAYATTAPITTTGLTSTSTGTLLLVALAGLALLMMSR